MIKVIIFIFNLFPIFMLFDAYSEYNNYKFIEDNYVLTDALVVNDNVNRNLQKVRYTNNRTWYVIK